METNAMHPTNSENLSDQASKQAEQLAMLTQVLDELTRSISHDFRAPLRAIEGFSRILSEDYQTALDDDAMHLIQSIRRNAERMSLIINSLISYSHASQIELEIEKIDLNRMAEDVISELKQKSPGRELQFELHALPEVCGDFDHIQKVLENLLHNAVKFTRNIAPAVIAIGSQVEEDRIIVFIRDNGAGFDMRYAGKLFGLFQRMHTEDQFEGLGVGLLIAKQIIEKHGGNIWLESKVNQGTSVFFSLPHPRGDEN